MAEILPFTFKKEEEEKTNEEKAPIEKNEDKDYVIRFLTLLMTLKIEEVLHFDVSPTTLEQSTKTVKGYRTDELFEWLENSNEKEWAKNAAFFKAICIELDSRLNT